MKENDRRGRGGPKTGEGKTRSSQNAYHHGLFFLAKSGLGHSPELEDLARAIAGSGAGALKYESARRIAAAQIELAQVRRARGQLLADFRAHAGVDQKFVRRLTAIERYEQRALARRRRAIRYFDSIRAE